MDRIEAGDGGDDLLRGAMMFRRLDDSEERRGRCSSVWRRWWRRLPSPAMTAHKPEDREGGGARLEGAAAVLFCL